MPSPSSAVVASPLPVPDTPFSGGAAWEQVRVLSEDIGSRPSGSPALQRAADYITARFAALGYRPAQQPYSFSSFQDGPVQFSVQQPDSFQVVARSLMYSGRGTVTGELVRAGLGRPADFPAKDLQGRIALVERGAGIPFQEKVNNAVARSAAAVIIYNNASGDFRGSLMQPASIPVVGISQYDGEKLLERMARGNVTVQLRVEAATETQQGANVVATAGSGPGRKKVIIGAHYDSIEAGPGANDNASGVGTMLEIARAARGHQYPFDLVFIAFGDEEIGLVGSKKYVESLSPNERRRVLAMINLDMVGVGDRMEFGGDAGLIRQATKIAQQSGQNAGDLDIRYGSSSDHASFRDAGIPVVFFYRSDDPNYHTAGDVAREVVPANLDAAGRTAMGLLDELAKAGT